MVDDLCIRWRKMDLKCQLKCWRQRDLSFDVRVNFACYFDRRISKKFSGLKKILWTLSRYSGCFMWNVEMGLTSGRRDARFFVNHSSVAKWPPSGRMSNSKMETISVICILDDIKRFFSRRCPPNNNCHQKLWEIDMGFLLFSLLTFYVLFLGLFYALRWKTWRRR